jgi:hypothetical protein
MNGSYGFNEDDGDYPDHYEESLNRTKVLEALVMQLDVLDNLRQTGSLSSCRAVS